MFEANRTEVFAVVESGGWQYGKTSLQDLPKVLNEWKSGSTI
jgi:hypothetical protein